jgi:hypothetical protein
MLYKEWRQHFQDDLTKEQRFQIHQAMKTLIETDPKLDEWLGHDFRALMYCLECEAGI